MTHYVLKRPGRKDLEWDSDAFDGEDINLISLKLDYGESAPKEEQYVLDRTDGETQYWVEHDNPCGF